MGYLFKKKRILKSEKLSANYINLISQPKSILYFGCSNIIKTTFTSCGLKTTFTSRGLKTTFTSCGLKTTFTCIIPFFRIFIKRIWIFNSITKNITILLTIKLIIINNIINNKTDNNKNWLKKNTARFWCS